MSDLLTRAIRTRNLDQATLAIAQLQSHMHADAIRAKVIATIERLAWDEGDPSAAAWILQYWGSRKRR
ncbi:MAG: hypothetical protein NW237_08840 [Cyanobacteriota bacterium]|nr:hypothetical protein [Cyanobacteriota bacterium]